MSPDTEHTSEENAKGFTDENGFRMGTFTLHDRPLKDFEMTTYSFEKTLEAGEKIEQPKQQRSKIEKPNDQSIAARSASGGEPVHISTLTEKAIRDLNLVEGETKIFLHPRLAGQTYKGEVRRVDEEHGVCFQKVGKQSLVLHRLEKIEGSPKVGETVKIAYDEKGEKAKLSVLEERQERHRGLHR